MLLKLYNVLFKFSLTYTLIVLFPILHKSRVTFSRYKPHCIAWIFTYNNTIPISIPLSTLQPALSEKKHVWIIWIFTKFIYYHWLEWWLITKPRKIFIENWNKIYPYTTVLVDYRYAYHIWERLNCLPWSIIYNFLKSIIILYKIM